MIDEQRSLVPCASCSVPVPTTARFCGTCGAPRAVMAVAVLPPTSVAATAFERPLDPTDSGARPASTALPAGVPVEVLVISGLLALGGAILVWEALRMLPGVFDLLGLGSIGRALGLLVLDLVAFVGAFGAAGMFLAWRLVSADRVARGLTYVLAGGTGAAILLGDEHGAAYVLVMLADLAAVGILALTPRVDAFFAIGDTDEQPVGVVVARTLVVAWAFCVVLTGALFLPAGALGARFVLVGLVLIGLGAAAFALNRGLSRGDPTARTVVTIGATLGIVATLVAGHSNTGTLLPIALAVGLVVELWGPEDCRRHFTSTSH
jgi:hypothetical protein